MRHISVRSEYSVFTLSVVFSYLADQHVIVSEACDYFHQICSAFFFEKKIGNNSINVR